MSNSNPLIYAELLSNIRQISIIATLDSPCDSSTNVALSENGQRLRLHHRGTETCLNLPGQVASTSQLQKPALGRQELSWRLPLAGQLSRVNPEGVPSNDAPWPATSLTTTSEFFCRSCSTVIVRKESIKSWEDLPSENWAEMMDFWHCHKPSDHKTNGSNGHAGHSHTEDSMVSRAYGANTKFTARCTVGFVDLTMFLLAESDCIGIETELSSEQSTKYPKLVCANCKHYLGHIDNDAEGYRLYKWRLKSPARSPTSPTPSYYEPSTASIITPQMHSIMLAQCCSKLVLLPMNWTPPSRISPDNHTAIQSSSSLPPSSSSSTFLSLWILSPNIRYAATTAPEPPRNISGTPAMKVFWKAVSAAEADKLMDDTAVEEVSLPAETILEIASCLRLSASFLPISGRKFQEWDVGLLERFEGGET